MTKTIDKWTVIARVLKRRRTGLRERAHATKSMFAATIALLSSQVLAAGWINARVVSVRIDQSGSGMVFFDQNVTGSPGCVIGAYQNALAFNANTAGGKAIYAMGLAAKTQGATVTAFGVGSCSTFGAYVEDWDYGVLQ